MVNEKTLKERPKLTVLNMVFGFTFLIFLILFISLSLPIHWITSNLIMFWVIPYIFAIAVYAINTFLFKSEFLKNLIGIICLSYPFIFISVSTAFFLLNEYEPLPASSHSFESAIKSVTVISIVIAILYIIAYFTARYSRRFHS